MYVTQIRLDRSTIKHQMSCCKGKWYVRRFDPDKVLMSRTTRLGIYHSQHFTFQWKLLALHIGKRLQGWYYVKNVSRQQHDKNRQSRIATVDSCFALVGAHQHCVGKICNASQRSNAHKLQNDSFTISSSVLWTHLRCGTRVATARVSERKKTKVSQLVSWKAKN